VSKKIKVAVTGGIGSGKSIVCDLLEKKGYPIIRADVLGKELLKNDSQVKAEIIREFGDEAYKYELPDHKFIAAQVFTNEQKLKAINSIIHPRTLKIIEMKMADYLSSHDIVFVESALIYEAEREELFDYILLVYSEDDLKISRIIERDQESIDNIRRRMENQIPDLQKKEWADFTIDNNGTLEDLNSKTEFILSLLKSM